MAYKFNPFTSNFDIDNSTIVAASDPASAADGTFLINTTTGKLKIYYASAWHIIFSFPGLGDNILLETGDQTLLETGDQALLESSGSFVEGDTILQEIGDDILIETGDLLLAETGVPGVTTELLFEDDTIFIFEDSTNFLTE